MKAYRRPIISNVKGNVQWGWLKNESFKYQMKYRYLSHHCLFTLCKSRVTTLPINILNCHFYLPHILMCPHKTWWYIFFALKEVVITWKEHAILTLSFYAPGNLIFKCYVGLNFPLDSFMWCLQSMLLLAIKITFGKYSNDIPKNDLDKKK